MRLLFLIPQGGKQGKEPLIRFPRFFFCSSFANGESSRVFDFWCVYGSLLCTKSISHLDDPPPHHAALWHCHPLLSTFFSALAEFRLIQAWHFFSAPLSGWDAF